MSADRFLASIVKLEGELSADQRVGLVAEARNFLAAGGVFSLDEWESFSPETRAALAFARRELRDADHAALAGAILRAQARPPSDVAAAAAASAPWGAVG